MYVFKHGTILSANTAEMGLPGPAILRPPALVSFADTRVPLNGSPLAYNCYLRLQSTGDTHGETGSAGASERLPMGLCPSSHTAGEPGRSQYEREPSAVTRRTPGSNVGSLP